MIKTIIKRRFRGPEQSGNGGYVCGLLASYVSGTAEVTLRYPPPLDTTLTIEKEDNGFVRLWYLEASQTILIGEAQSADLELSVPPPVSYQAAQDVSRQSPAFDYHPFTECFVCGISRQQGDGLNIFPGLVKPGTKVVAAPWKPHQSLAGSSGKVSPEFIWAALDCPGGFAAFVANSQMNMAVLGRMTVLIKIPIHIDEPCVLMGWSIREEGRKCFAGTALYNESGHLAALAKAIWIRPSEGVELNQR